MEPTTQNGNAALYFLGSILFNVITWITLVQAQYFVSFITTVLGAISAVFVIRYYYYAGNEKKRILKNED